MALKTTIAFRGMDNSEAVKEIVESRAEKIERHFPHVHSCDVVIEQATKSRSQGNLFSVALEFEVPGAENVYVSRDAGKDHAHEDVYVAIRDAFEAAHSQLEKLKTARSPT